MPRYDIDGTLIKMVLHPSDKCPKCGDWDNKKTLFILHAAALECHRCGETFNRYAKVEAAK